MKRKKSVLCLLVTLLFAPMVSSCNMADINLSGILGGVGSVPSEKQEVTKLEAITNSLRADNISAKFYIAEANGEQMDDTWSINMDKDAEKVRVYSNQVEGMNYYFRDSENGCEIYDEGKYIKLEDYNPNLFTMIPLPTFENIFYTNYGIYQDGVGQITDIIALHIEELYYDEATGFYKIDNINIEHGELDSYYATQPDKLVIGVSVLLSDDGNHIKTIICDIISSELGIGGMKVRMDFYNHNSTIVELP